MARLRVKRANRDRDGVILGLCGDNWSKTKAEIVQDLETPNGNRYFVEEQAPSVDVIIFPLAGVKHLFTVADKTSKNNLDNLDPC